MYALIIASSLVIAGYHDIDECKRARAEFFSQVTTASACVMLPKGQYFIYSKK
jgi:hypothetical protein